MHGRHTPKVASVRHKHIIDKILQIYIFRAIRMCIKEIIQQFKSQKNIMLFLVQDIENEIHWYKQNFKSEVMVYH